MSDGQKITFEREGDQDPDVTPGDVHFTLRTTPHANFTRQGDDLHMKYRIPLKEALLGFKRRFKHLDGRDVELKRTSVTQPGFVDEVVGEGMPKHSFPSEQGNLFVEYIVDLPEKLTNEQRDRTYPLRRLTLLVMVKAFGPVKHDEL
jgi:DnaJ-related protein SCJ1